ncbi:sodium ion-translocating decarboxylase subunit beta, partial [Thermosipho sp. 1244]
MLESLLSFFQSTAFMHISYGNLIMFGIAGLLIYIAIEKDAEPLLLIPIAFGIILANIPPDITGILNPPSQYSPGGVLWYIQQGLVLGIYPPLIFLGIGALTDFSFMLSYPITIFLGGAAQMGIFITFLLARVFGFTLKQAASIGIIGGADGPTSIFITSKFAPELLSIIAISAYSYIALIPVLQPLVSKLMTTKEERRIKMKPPRKVTKVERVLFPILTTII